MSKFFWTIYPMALSLEKMWDWFSKKFPCVCKRQFYNYYFSKYSICWHVIYYYSHIYSMVHFFFIIICYETILCAIVWYYKQIHFNSNLWFSSVIKCLELVNYKVISILQRARSLTHFWIVFLLNSFSVMCLKVITWNTYFITEKCCHKYFVIVTV